MLEIRYSEQYWIEVSGTVAELEAVRQGIYDLARGAGTRVFFEAGRDFDPSPYEKSLKRMVIAIGESPVKVFLTGEDEMWVEGGPESLAAFASYFGLEPGAAAGTHSHFEYDEGGWRVAAGSVPLVVSVR